MTKISQHIQQAIHSGSIEFQTIRAQGAGGQNVNKVSSAVHCRFDIMASSLPDHYKTKLLQLNDRRISKDGMIVIKAQRYRTQDLNKQDALARLQNLIMRVAKPSKKRKATKPSKASKTRRLDHKTKAGKQKALRRKIRI